MEKENEQEGYLWPEGEGMTVEEKWDSYMGETGKDGGNDGLHGVRKRKMGKEVLLMRGRRWEGKLELKKLV